MRSDSADDQPRFLVRSATVDDAETIAGHRATMWRGLGRVDEAGQHTMVEVTREALRRLIPEGAYRGWLALDAADPSHVVGGIGIHLRESLPRVDSTGRIASSLQALFVNVYTEAAWRRRGVADRLMREGLAWCAATGVENVILHASDEGRPLYERLGFVPTNEMRFPPPG